MSLVSSIATAPISFYRRFISPYKPRMCRFSPTCSQYAIEALEKHGLLRGSMLAIWRILRCQPFARGGHDPVPARDDQHRHHHHPGHLHE
jgi:putative membrane protein insertion efficiency factor